MSRRNHILESWYGHESTLKFDQKRLQQSHKEDNIISEGLLPKMVQQNCNYFTTKVGQYHIDLEPIIYEWTNEMMMGYMGI